MLQLLRTNFKVNHCASIVHAIFVSTYWYAVNLSMSNKVMNDSLDKLLHKFIDIIACCTMC